MVSDAQRTVLTHLMKREEESGAFIHYLLPAAAGLVALIVYGATMAPDLTWAHSGSDGGELITASVTSGIPHPPGYPTYVFLGKLFALLPVGSVAWRFNLMSAVAAAVAVAFTTATALNTLEEKRHGAIASLATGLTVAFAPLLWSQALIAEVYTVNLAFLAIFLWSVLGCRSPLLSGLFLGLAITSHLSSLLLLPLALVLIPRGGRCSLAAGLILGLTPLLALPVLANSGSPVIWGDPTTFSGWWWLVSGRLYYANLRLPQAGEAGAKLLSMSDAFLRQFLYAGWLLVVLGVSTRIVNRRTMTTLAGTGLLYLIYGYLYQTDDAINHILPALLLLSPLLAAGLSRLGSWSLLLPLGLLLVNFQALTLHNDREVRPLAEDVLASAPENSVLLTPGDQSIFTLWYYHHVEQVRPDLMLVDANLLAFDWYRQRVSEQYPDLEALERDDGDAFRAINGQKRFVCDVAPALGGISGCTPAPGRANGG
jgi:hypothetical protein